jgi:hypothetical protein
VVEARTISVTDPVDGTNSISIPRGSRRWASDAR